MNKHQQQRSAAFMPFDVKITISIFLFLNMQMTAKKLNWLSLFCRRIDIFFNTFLTRCTAYFVVGFFENIYH